MGQLGFYYDMTGCTGCKTCQIACNDKNDLKVGTLYRKVDEYEGGVFPKPWIYYLSTSCNHCENPMCVSVCPTGAITKREEDGIVLIDEEKCDGTKSCIIGCPYDVPQFLEEKNVVGKCDFCIDLLEKGEEPACVASCTMRVLKFGDIDELRAEYGEVADVKPLPESFLTNPAIVITPKKEAL